MLTSPAHEIFMKRCFDLALEGLGYTYPNPLVGSVIVYNNNIIGEGYHKKSGEPHAEVNAIHAVKDKNLLKKSTLYVNLEPCSHFGKTPPCSDLIIKSGIPRVVISNIDPNSLVKGRGIEKLRNAGVEVITDILTGEGEEINKRFFLFQKYQRPYIILKWAQTKDGFVDIIRNIDTPQKPNWITNQYARMMVHKWRSEEQAILIGTNTALNDNPKLNVRNWTGNSPLRILLDRNLRLPEHLHILDKSLPTLVFTEQANKIENSRNLIYHTTVFDKNLPEYITMELFRQNIQSLLIEGGTKTLQSFIDAGLWDEARVFTGEIYFNNGIPAPVMNVKISKTETWSGFSLSIYKNTYDLNK